MNEQNSVLNIIGKVSGFLSKYIAVVILITSAVAFTHTQKFMWIPQYTALFLGTAMFGMGLTIKREDFQIVFSRPKEVISGCILQYTIMPLAAYFLAVVMNLDTDIALGVILVGCCPGGTASNVIAYIAKGDVPLSVGMTITSTLIAPLVTPVLVYLLAGEESARSDAWDEPEGPRLAVAAQAPVAPWVQGAFELAKAGFTLLAKRGELTLRVQDVRQGSPLPGKRCWKRRSTAARWCSI